MSVDDEITNPTDNRPFEDVLRARVSRRGLMIGSLATAATTFFAAGGGLASARPGGNGRGNGNGQGPPPGRGKPGSDPVIGFTPAINTGGPDPSIAPEYTYSVLIPWGTALAAGVPPFDDVDPTNNTASAQERQVGIGHDGMWFFPIGRSNDHGILCINHEFGRNPHVLGKPLPESLDDVRKSQAAHGVSVVEIRRTGSTWLPVVPSPYNRRITGNTEVSFSGPAAGSPLLTNAAGNPPQGTLNNCANGFTPWGTYLTCEENFNGYFGTEATDWEPDEEQDRYGFSAGSSYAWHLYDRRFDLSDPDYANEGNRFGWIMEIDPMDPNSTPVKRTALGRVKHEGIALTVGRGGRVVGYMGDDQRFDYIYKFVSRSNWRSMRARGISPLDEGQLYVAKFNDDGTGEWLELTIDNPVLAARFADQAELLVYTRIAADLLGATPMDRPEWTTVAPDGQVYCALTNNSQRTVADAANPLAPNPDGHIIRWRDSDQFTGTTFEWDIFLIAEDTHLENGATDPGAEFSDPDGLWADPDGRIFIQTDGGQKNGRNNQMLVADPVTAEVRRLFAGVSGDEITGIAVTPDRRTMFINTQHPGNGDPTRTNFPVPSDEATGNEIPRDSTIVITRRDGGVIGT